jgi:hypothetical protein
VWIRRARASFRHIIAEAESRRVDASEEEDAGQRDDEGQAMKHGIVQRDTSQPTCPHGVRDRSWRSSCFESLVVHASRRSKIAACILGGALVASSVGTSSIARAEDDTARARALFDEAGELERQGRWGAAQERLRAALRIKETPHLRYALGWALENDDKLIEAKNEYETALRLAQQRNVEEVLRLAGVRLADLEQKTPVVEVRVPHGIAPNTHVIVDGRPAPVRDDIATVPVNPGSRVVRIERPNHAPTEQLIYVSRGTVRVIDVDADEALVASRTHAQERHTPTTIPKRDAAATHEGRGGSVLPWVLIGGGTALVVGGGALLVSSGSDASERDRNQGAWCEATACSDGTTATRPETTEAEAFRRDALDAANRGNAKQIAGISLGVAGLISAGIGTWMLVRGGSDGRTKDRIQVSGGPIPRGAFAGALLRF